MIPEAREAVKGEHTKLRKSGAWDESKVREWSDVVKELRARRAKHPQLKGPLRGRVFPLCVVKNSEIAHLRRYKGRVVFQGNNVRDEFGMQALFPDQGSGASFMTASRVMDAISILPGCTGQQSDAPQAYTQCHLGTGMEENTQKTWVELPEGEWPP